ncbi:tRNA (adenosine(37)-N6)-threonylcarbamoyltransferase complex ATPase subunit type 1 TsaE [Granulosicoccus antarcticus]|uniref:tRNA threonylcarbamoyladenosine biosynthesis protein TsaE n=1 Tax=Granulosicoccus antarcticus IMCC3135 TaxID=1192854 RepID=A0A2Z2NMK5_9GAMM|nr:tRNA (adenosine(37)-N6)-threonylcarbamoyltransferase complex ATPase subunit type 1 TsaE [Granulosicoccus antarcticus]ASJ72443.1 tRNA threonylcarbamoyladenosine biosynthesis protein TsaE [Granulosicoccus antarcticus IMCC3135]
MNQEQYKADLARFIHEGVRDIADETSMQLLGEKLASCVPKGALWTLSGELGAGKSVLVRSVIHALGYKGRVKSPTYTLIETYDVSAQLGSAINNIAHLDLYRLQDPAELDYLGFDDLIREHDLVMIEWPEQGGDRLPRADLHISITYGVEDRRQVVFSIP